jgi:hypothetical protein
VSRPVRPLSPAAAGARAALPADDAAAFDRMASAVLASPSAALGAVLRSHVPGPAGLRRLRTAGLSPATRVSALTGEQWLALFRCWQEDTAPPGRSPARGSRVQRSRTSAHGHAPGALAAPRWH